MITREEQVPYPHYSKNLRAHMGCIAKIGTWSPGFRNFLGLYRVIDSWSLKVMGEGEYILHPQPNNFDTEDGSRFFL